MIAKGWETVRGMMQMTVKDADLLDSGEGLVQMMMTRAGKKKQKQRKPPQSLHCGYEATR